jgi:hypothetical protein
MREGFHRVELNKTVWEVADRYVNLTPVGSGAYGQVIQPSYIAQPSPIHSLTYSTTSSFDYVDKTASLHGSHLLIRIIFGSFFVIILFEVLMIYKNIFLVVPYSSNYNIFFM